MLPEWFVLFAAAVRLTSGVSYAWAVVKNRAKPNPITWFFWALTPAIVFCAQLFEHVGWQIIITFALGFGPFVVFILSLKRNWRRSQFTPATIACGVLATVGVILWLSTNDPTLAIIFSMFADASASVPTIIKARHDPKSEYLPAYAITMASVVITLLSVHDWRFANVAFPIYILIINAVIFSAGIFAPSPVRKIRAPKVLVKPRRLTSARR